MVWTHGWGREAERCSNSQEEMGLPATKPLIFHADYPKNAGVPMPFSPGPCQDATVWSVPEPNFCSSVGPGLPHNATETVELTFLVNAEARRGARTCLGLVRALPGRGVNRISMSARSLAHSAPSWGRGSRGSTASSSGPQTLRSASGPCCRGTRRRSTRRQAWSGRSHGRLPGLPWGGLPGHQPGV